MSGQNRNTATEDGEAGDGEVSGEVPYYILREEWKCGERSHFVEDTHVRQ